MSSINLKGIETHNLRAIDLDISIGKVTLIKGPSGAGKSSLAFDTLYAESQRRYIETFSPYARQFLERLPRPQAKIIEHLPAAIAIGQTNPVRSARSTVGTLAEVTYPARHLFFREASLLCPACGRKVADERPDAVLAGLTAALSRDRKDGFVYITTQVSSHDAASLSDQGYGRILVDGEIKRLSDVDSYEGLGEVFIVVDRLNLADIDPSRVIESAEQAFALGDGRLFLHFPAGEVIRFSRGRHCPYCDVRYAAPSPDLFSFNSPAGACPICHGFGRVMAVDWDQVVPDKTVSIRQGAIRPVENWPEEKAEIIRWCERNGVDVDIPWAVLNDDAKNAILLGHGSWPGVKAYFDYLETKRYKAHVRILLSRYRTYLTCPECGGSRFRKEVSQYVIKGLTLPGLYALSISDAILWFKDTFQTLAPDKATQRLLEEISSRLSTLEAAGLGYLTLDRQSRTLSGGEVARIAMSRAIGTDLTQTLYVLDEPTAGLHPADRWRLIGLIARLKARGNTVVVVEHDPQFEMAADTVVELGPGSGGQGGRITYLGPARPDSGRLDMTAWPKREPDHDASAMLSQKITVTGAKANNLKDITVSFPVNSFTCLTGVSGSGKSTLLELVLYRGLLREMGLPSEPPGGFSSIIGAEHVNEVYLVGQSSIGRTPRACPASYLHILDGIRTLFYGTKAARALGLSKGDFSFNSGSGRCPVCNGQGTEIIEMQFLPDITLPCPVCKGRRFKNDILSVTYKGQNIFDILQMTIDEAASFFEDIRGVIKAIVPSMTLGLGYLRLGQPLSTLSPGEVQRLKLAGSFASSSGTKALFLLDEPSRGLGEGELIRLLKAIHGLLERGHTILAVEHEPGLVAAADWVIDLGPYGGAEGGRLIYEGPPAGLSGCKESLTGIAIRQRMGSGQGALLHETGPLIVEERLDAIKIKGARHHNLKNVDVSIPHGKFVVITGPSGSGKSSLAFDIVFSEGQRRFVEGLSFYMRQFIRLYERPDVDSVTGLTPSISIEQRTSEAGPRSTVATLTEVAHYLRLLYAKVALPVCPSCKKPFNASARDGLQKAVQFICPECAAMLSEPDPLLFSFHTKTGECKSCSGRGLSDSGDLCPACLGSRLNDEARAWKINGLGIDGLFALEVSEAMARLSAWLLSPPWSDRLDVVARPIAKMAVERLKFLSDVGLDYLPLERAGDTLSGGEAQRIRLAAQIGSGLTGVTIVLDEPTIGLHPKDNKKLISALKSLKKDGATVIAVEHDEATLCSADWIIDLGPKGGRRGGEIVAQGSVGAILKSEDSLTGKMLREGKGRIVPSRGRDIGARGWLSIKGINLNNINGLDVEIPLGCLIAICGVSGSGKSTLMTDAIGRLVDARLKGWAIPPCVNNASGLDAIDRLFLVDHNPIGKTPRSCPATYVGFLTDIRELFAQTQLARARGYAPSRFSFNSEDGRCPVCKGQGSQRVSLGFLPDIYVKCESCQGRRFESAILDVKWKGKDIAEVLEMTIDEAREFFRPVPRLFRPISTLCDIGLGYLTLGQPSPSLSGGEAQRIKIARGLASGVSGHGLYLMDEPTTGLHMHDVRLLAETFHRLVDQGHSVMVIEHNLDLISSADWILELGPGGGKNGGKIVFSGPLEQFMASDIQTPTREALQG
jgi:excinuclease ABC A subunit